MNGLDPEIAAFIERLRASWREHPSLDGMTPSEARRVAELVRAPWRAGGPVMASTQELTADTAAGPVGLRIHRPAGLPDGPAPTLLYVHGGGFVFFSLDSHDRLMREYAAAGGFVVVGVDYPLSPEARYPLALNRIAALVDWLAEHGPALGVNPALVAIGGDSVGANLSIAACLKRRDDGAEPALLGILSNYGAFSGVCSDAAEAAHGGPDAILTQAEMVWYFEQYLDPAGGDAFYAQPIDVPDLGRLPPVFLNIPERDVLAEQSFRLATRLAEAGVPVTTRVYPGATHSFLEAMSIAQVARDAIADGAEWLAGLFKRQPATTHPAS